MALFSHIKHPKKRAFLAAYSACANIKRAAKIADVARETHYDWMEADPEYAAAFKGRATEIGGDAAEDEATRRAEVGVLEYVVSRGQLVMIPVLDEQTGLPVMAETIDFATGEVTLKPKMKPLMKRKYSDRLLMARLKALKPEKYGDKTELRTANNAPLSIAVKFV